jgi:hypothetical protein
MSLSPLCCLRSRPLGRLTQIAAAPVLALVALVLIAPRPASALTDEEVYRTLRFQVDAPGARAMGMGGAGVAVADDPGAAYTNPAGLAFLDRPQIMMSFKGTNFDDSAWSTSGTVPGLVPSTASGALLLEEDGVFAPEFLSYVHPIGKRWVVGVSRHERLNVERDSFASYDSTAFPTFEGSLPGVSREALSTVASLDALMDVWGANVAVKPHETVSIGVSAAFARLDVVQTLDNYTYSVLDANGNGMADTLLRPIDYRTHVDDDDQEFTFTAGILWRPMDTLAIGAVYRDGPRFDVIEQVRPEGVSAKSLREYLFASGVANVEGEFLNTWSFPDSYAVGLAFGPYARGRRGEGGLTIAVDAEHVEYADLLDGFVGGLNQQYLGASAIGKTYILEDETNFRLGIAYAWSVGYNNLMAVRIGAYTDPDHSLVSAASASGGAFVGRDDVVHGTAGLGVTLKRGFYSFTMDAAADVSELGEQYLTSAILKF